MSSNEGSSFAAEMAALKEIYAAINRNDVSAVLTYFHSDIERIEPEGFPAAGIVRGLDEMEAHISQGRGTWAEGGCEPERFIFTGDKIVVFVHVRVRLKDKSEWIDAHIADGFTFKDGKVNLMRTFVEREQALKWAGVKF